MKFEDQNGTFSLENAENESYLYFPIAGTEGLKSSITPNLGGDSKIDQNTFLMEPVSAENLHNNKSGRNFWCRIAGKGCFSAAGASAQAENDRGTDRQDFSRLTAGYMWQKIERESERYQLRSEITTFIPVGKKEEVLLVKIENKADTAQTITPIGVVPIYARSAENIRDHRHVTSLLHRIDTDRYGVKVTPTMSFDERGHQKNNWTYYVCGVTQNGEKPTGFYPDVEHFLGEGGSFAHPGAVYGKAELVQDGFHAEGIEAVGAIAYPEVTLAPGETAGYVLVSGLTQEVCRCEQVMESYDSWEKAERLFTQTAAYWQKAVNVEYHTGNPEFDQYMKWVNFQPVLRRIYGCSFLPHHDYGKGGRGWRDLWQDCLALLLMNPVQVREMILNHFAGVRMDGTNATIIGAKAGEFVADRNHIARVWMDHAFWPFLTTKLYLDQTGDFSILEEKVPYFKDQMVCRGMETDALWKETDGTRQHTESGESYLGSVLEHLLIQNLCAFYETGEHGHCRLRGADWNDALDMAAERGESVAFTCAYAGNLRDLASYLEKYRKRTGTDKVLLCRELGILLQAKEPDHMDTAAKTALLKKYSSTCIHAVSGEKSEVLISDLVENLSGKAAWMMQHIRKTEWVGSEQAGHWYNGYYDNHARQVEGVTDGQTRMMLTGQVFAIMSGTAQEEQVAEICKSADRYLYRREIGGYRLNTDFHEIKMDLGRMFGFAYGEKENGAVFSHMTVMYANALYQRGFVKEGYLALQTLMDAAMNFQTSKIYPGLPEYFNARGRGMYHYLTGAASWYMLTMITQVFGIRGVYGDLKIEPKLLARQFDEAGNADIQLSFADRELKIVVHNPEKCEYGMYEIASCSADNDLIGGIRIAEEYVLIDRERLLSFEAGRRHKIVINLLCKVGAGEK